MCVWMWTLTYGNVARVCDSMLRNLSLVMRKKARLRQFVVVFSGNVLLLKTFLYTYLCYASVATYFYVKLITKIRSLLTYVITIHAVFNQ